MAYSLDLFKATPHPFPRRFESSSSLLALQYKAMRLPRTFRILTDREIEPKLRQLSTELQRAKQEGFCAHFSDKKRRMDALGVDLQPQSQKNQEAWYMKALAQTQRAVGMYERMAQLKTRAVNECTTLSFSKATIPNSFFSLMQRIFLGAEPKTRNTLGSGTYGCVEEVKVDMMLAEKKPYKGLSKEELKQCLADSKDGPGRQDEAKQIAQKARSALDREMLFYLQAGAHPNIVEFYGASEEGIYLGLAQTSLRDQAVQENLSRNLLIQHAKDVLNGLKFIHEKKIIHKDIKPDNLLLDKQGAVRICDFGVSAKDQNDTNRQGTPGYIAPEVYYSTIGKKFQGHHPLSGQMAIITRKADIWSFGVVLFELLTGVHPYEVLKCDIEERIKPANFDSLPYPKQKHILANARKEWGLEISHHVFSKHLPEISALETNKLKLEKIKRNHGTASVQYQTLMQKINDQTRKLTVARKQNLKPTEALFEPLSEKSKKRLERLDPTKELRDIALKCLHADPEQRPSAEEVLQMFSELMEYDEHKAHDTNPDEAFVTPMNSMDDSFQTPTRALGSKLSKMRIRSAPGTMTLLSEKVRKRLLFSEH